MPKKSEQLVYQLSAVCITLTVASFIVPRFVPNPEGGFAGAASAILVLLVMLAMTLLVSIYLLVITIKKFSDLSTPARTAGIAPGVLLAAILFGLLGFLNY